MSAPQAGWYTVQRAWWARWRRGGAVTVARRGEVLRVPAGGRVYLTAAEAAAFVPHPPVGWVWRWVSHG